MILRTIASGLALTTLTVATSPAFATSLEEKDAYFLSCVTEYVNRNMGSPDAAAAYCYTKAYGSETSGGGAPNQMPLPIGRTDCGSVSLIYGCDEKFK